MNNCREKGKSHGIKPASIPLWDKSTHMGTNKTYNASNYIYVFDVIFNKYDSKF